MPAVVARAVGAHDLLANEHATRNRSVSDVSPPVEHEPEPDNGQLPKAASYTYFPRVKDLVDDPSVLELKGTISEEELKSSAHNGSYSSSDGSSPDSEDAPAEQLQMRLTLRPSNSRRSSRFLSFTSQRRDPSTEPKPDRSRPETQKENRKQADSPSSMSPVRSLSNFRRKSWIATKSRSSSPTKETREHEEAKKKALASVLSIPDKSRTKDVTESPDSPSSPRNRLISKKAKRLSGLFNASNVQHDATPVPDVPAVPPIPKSFSIDRLPSHFSPTSPTHIPPLPRNLSSDKLKGARTEPRKKDELWSVFRTLEADHRKFQSKSMALKANVVRTTLLPFLRSYAAHPSNHRLRPEDLDRRANILNGWWTGLLELLAGRNNQSISGTDRPAILEAIAGVMERPEWRTAPSPFAALADRVETGSTTTAHSAGSNSSNSSDFLAESVYHNVRNIFTQNLLLQMAFVVDKMALRNAASSLVTFCGKTCAYAFCFCPGIADVLVRLWNPTMDVMKRVLEESEISRQDRLETVSERVVQSFPPMLHSLKFQTLTRTVRLLRRPAPLPLGTANLDWHGTWVKRWLGAESDLFYVFVKHWHILVADFLPVEPSNAERICVPGLIMVHAQILKNLDATVNRHAVPSQTEDPMTTSGANPITFDDVLEAPDTSVSALPIPPANATRLMAENRIIMLIRDFLSERNAHLGTSRKIFAESFGRLLKGAARKVSVYNSNACYTLCDFLEEAFVILVRYEQLDPQRHSVLDWSFWLSVCKQMTASQNTATEIKLFAFLYGTWSTLTSDESRKGSLCLDFLLEPEFFESRFNHWCPMVRSYYMRLLCWRVARFDGDDTVTDINIMRALSDRLRSVWSHYLWIREEAESRHNLPPSTQACNPAPGRRFLIIRNDTPIITNAGPFISFDGVVQSFQAQPPPKRLPLNAPATPDVRPPSAQSTDSDFPDEEVNKGRWSILRNLISAPKTSSKSRSPGPTAKEKEKTAKGSHGVSSSNAPDTSSTSKTVTPEKSPSPPPAHRSYSFRFSLEWVDKRFGNYQNMRLNPPRLPLPGQVLLQTKGINIHAVKSCKPTGPTAMSSRYAGRALAEWTFISHECQNFFDRRKNEGVPSNRLVETPTLAVEAFRRPG